MLANKDIKMIRVNEIITIASITENDRNRYVELLNDEEIYKNTLRIPYPYTLEDADWWLKKVEKLKEERKVEASFSIREKNIMIGGIGFQDYRKGDKVVEIGYWLASAYWSKGIMTAVIDKITYFGFKKYKIEKIIAHIFAFNIASGRVLEKNGFEYERKIKNHYKKDGKLIDSLKYSKTGAQG